MRKKALDGQFISKHRRRLNWIVSVAALINGSAVLLAVGGLFFGMELFLTRKILIPEFIFGLASSVTVGGLFGWLLWIIFRRNLAVMEVRLSAGECLEIVTWPGRRFAVKMPENVHHATLDKANDMLAVAFQTEGRIFVIDSADYSDGAKLNQFFRKITTNGKLQTLTMDQIKTLYLENGFFWNTELQEFVGTYSGHEIAYRHPITQKQLSARFIRPELIKIGRRKSPCNTVCEFLNEEVVPVGDCDNAHIDLLLSSTGKLIGFADYMLLKWPGHDSGWRESLKSLLAGKEPETIGIIDT